MTLANQVQNIVRTTIENAAGMAPEINVTDELIQSGLLDSLTLLQLFVNLQSEFDIEIDTMDLTEENFKSIEAMAQFLETRDITVA